MQPQVVKEEEAGEWGAVGRTREIGTVGESPINLGDRVSSDIRGRERQKKKNMK